MADPPLPRREVAPVPWYFHQRVSQIEKVLKENFLKQVARNRALPENPWIFQ